MPRPSWTVPVDSALVGTGGHLHPGGLWTDLTLTRDGRSTRLFRSEAIYYEPAGAVSWDVSMTVTPPDWRVQLRKGDVLRVSGTYDTTAGVVVRVDGDHADDVGPGRDGRGPVHDERRRQGRGHARPPAGERQPRRRPAVGPREPARAALAARARQREADRDPGLRLRAGRPQHDRPARPPRAGAQGPRAEVRQPRRRAHDLPHGHRVQGAVQSHDRDRLSARRRRGRLRLAPARLRPARVHGRGQPRHVEDAQEPQGRAGTPTSAACTRSCGARSR